MSAARCTRCGIPGSHAECQQRTQQEFRSAMEDLYDWLADRPVYDEEPSEWNDGMGKPSKEARWREAIGQWLGGE